MEHGHQVTDQKRCIVLPFRSGTRNEQAAAGLALHFLLGNVLALHRDLQEFWFGWRVAKIFPGFAEFSDYCRAAGPGLDLEETGRQQNLRYWVSGECRYSGIRMQLFDARAPDMTSSADIDFSCKDDLIGFRTTFLDWFGRCSGRPFPRQQLSRALWPETMTRPGLESVGEALSAFYRFAFVGDQGSIELPVFETAVNTAPDSFMAHNLLGWALYRDQQAAKAAACFRRALEINPSGAGAMAGLMWCAFLAGDREAGISWAGQKAIVCGQDKAAAREKAEKRFEKA